MGLPKGWKDLPIVKLIELADKVYREDRDSFEDWSDLVDEIERRISHGGWRQDQIDQLVRSVKELQSIFKLFAEHTHGEDGPPEIRKELPKPKVSPEV